MCSYETTAKSKCNNEQCNYETSNKDKSDNENSNRHESKTEMKKTMLLGFVGMLGSASGALLYWLSPQQASDSGQHHSVIVAKDSPVEADVLTQPISKTSIEQRLALGQQRRKGLALNEADFKLNIAQSELFEMSDAQTMADRNPRLMSNMQLQDGRVFIQNDPYVLESKTVGDRIAFTAVGYGLKRQGVIQQVHIDPKEDIVTWTGVLEGGDPNRELFSISQSLKDQFTAGTIQSQGKTYVVMVKNGYGWLKDLDQEAAADHRRDAKPCAGRESLAHFPQ